MYVDPLADDSDKVVQSLSTPSVILMAHNRHVTYGYTGTAGEDAFYCDIPDNSVVVDPWRSLPQDLPNVTVIHYGNTRQN